MKIHKRQTVKRICDDKKQSVKQYVKETYMGNRTPNIAYKNSKYHENLEVRLLYQKCRY